MMLLLDPPDHTRLRRPVTRAFTARRVAELRPRAEAVAADLLDAVAARGPDAVVDLIDAYAVPLPVAVVCELLWVPESDRDEFGAWSNAMIDDADQADTHGAMVSMGQCFGRLLAAKATRPDDALLTALLVAGHETSANLIGDAALGLLTDAHLRQRAAGASSMPAVVEEFLRFDSPVSNTPCASRPPTWSTPGRPSPRAPW